MPSGRRIAPFLPVRGSRANVSAAASSIVEGGNPANPDAVIANQEEWQKRAQHLINAIPEAKAAASYVANSLGRVKFTVEGIADPGVAATINRALQTFSSGRIAENIFRVGEGVISYQYDAAEQNVRWWDYSIFEYRATEKKAPEVKKRDGKWEDLPPQRKNFRVWRPSSSDRWEADSNHLSLLDVMESLFIHQLADKAVAQSRLIGAGILWWPNDDMPSAAVETDEPEPGSQQDIARKLVASMQLSLRDRKAADAVIPFLYFGSAEHSQGLRHLLLERQDNSYSFNERLDGYRTRYAGGIDLPAEVVLGIADANHWTAWKVDENTWTYYLAPLAQMIATALNRNFVQPVARQLMQGQPVGVTKVVADGSEVIAKPDRTEPAIQLRAQGVITRAAAAREAGFQPEDVEMGPDPILDAIGQANAAAVQLPVADSQRAPVQAASRSPEVRLARIAKLLMAEEASAHQRIQDALLAGVPNYLKAQQRLVRAASTDPEAELAALAGTTSAITRTALERRIRILSQSTGADADALLARYEGIIARRAQAVAQASTSYAQYVASTQSIQRAAEAGAPLNRFEQIRLMPATVGGMISIMNGGRNEFNQDFTQLTDQPATFATDVLVKEPLVEGGLDYVPVYTWTRGDPQNPFEPHVELEGATWTSFSEADFLDNAHLGVNPAGVWFPGDHVGCQCEYEITFEPVATAGA